MYLGNLKNLTFGFESVTGANRVLKLSATRTAIVTSSCFTTSVPGLDDPDFKVLLELILEYSVSSPAVDYDTHVLLKVNSRQHMMQEKSLLRDIFCEAPSLWLLRFYLLADENHNRYSFVIMCYERV